MNYYLDEESVALKIINSGDINNNTIEKISLIARYYYYTGLKFKNISNSIKELMLTNYKNYNPDKWEDTINYIVRKVAKYPLVKIDYIPITAKEMNVIAAIKNKKLEKLAFTLLVFAKYGNAKNLENNNWVAVDDSAIFDSARITGSSTSQCLSFNDLFIRGLIKYARKPNNTNSQILFVDDSDDIVMKITDLRCLGYEYLRYKGEKFIECAECGVLVRPSSPTHKYCKSCAGYTPMITKKIICCDCGNEFVVESKDNITKRCRDCYIKYRNTYKAQKEKERRHNQRQCVDSTIKS